MSLITLPNKSSVYRAFIDMNNDKLKLLSPTNRFTFESDIWHFKNRKDSHTANFSCFRHPYTQFTQHITLLFNNEKINISTIDFAKLLVLSLMEGKVVNAKITRLLECLAILFSYLKSKQLDRLSLDDFEDLYTLMLTHNPGDKSLTSRYSVPSFASRLNVFNVRSLLRLLKGYGCDNFLLPNVTTKHYTKALNAACLNLMGLTLADYKKGGTLNFLGLDTGRHYVDFCSDTFETHAVYATACRITYNSIIKEVQSHIEYKTHYTIRRICVETLMGTCLDKIDNDFVKKMTKKPREFVRRKTLELFCKNYNSLSQQANAFKLENINTIVNKLGLPKMRFDNQEFVRALLFAQYYGENGKSREQILKEFQSSLSGSQIEIDWGLEKFDSTVKSVIQVSCQTPESAFQLCKEHFEQCSKFRTYSGGVALVGADKLRHALVGIESAGATVFVAMTGWRASEFGFPLSDVRIAVNQDILDSIYTPYRFHVNWVVPKTSSTTPLQREITLANYVLATQLAQLNRAKPEDPCLYAIGPKTKYPHESENSIEKRIETLWQGFCEHYSMFVELDELESLQALARPLSDIEENKLKYLNNSYDIHSSQTKELQSLRDRLRNDQPRYNLAKGTNDNTFRNQLLRYQNDSLSTQTRALLERYLSDKTKHALKDKLIKLDLATVKSIRTEFLEGVPYPTAHAMRHMWAEAVLRRYRGDVGRFIRANFKHLNESFFMAYLRNKEMSTVHQIAERNVINSVVRQHLLAQKDNKREYAGGFDSYLNKVVKLTNIQSHEDYIKTAKKISENRVISLKPNAWSTCLLRLGTEQAARCAENGIPQRHNASPKLCLGCINADVTAGNFNGIVVYTRPEVEACRNSELPAFMKVHCIEVLKPALVQVKKLRKNSDNPKYDKFIFHLEESINMAQREVENSNV